MPYNSYYPIGYQPFGGQYNYQPQQPMASMQPQQQTQPTPQPMTSSIIWVQGEAGAKSYLVAPNTTVQLWDSERQTIYIKSADASGKPSLKAYDLVERAESASAASSLQQSKATDYATKSDLDALSQTIDALKSEVKSVRKEIDKKKKKEEDDDDE